MILFFFGGWTGNILSELESIILGMTILGITIIRNTNNTTLRDRVRLRINYVTKGPQHRITYIPTCIWWCCIQRIYYITNVYNNENIPTKISVICPYLCTSVAWITKYLSLYISLSLYIYMYIHIIIIIVIDICIIMVMMIVKHE